MERKGFGPKQLDEKGSGVAVIATLTPPGSAPVIDKDGDMTLPGAFGSAVVPLLVSHDWAEIPAGKAWIREEGNEARAYFQINLATTNGEELYEALRFDLNHPPAKTQFSYGFTIPPGGAEFRTLEDGRRVRVLKRLEVHEVSSVIVGAGVGTRLVALKSPDELAGVVREGERLLRLQLSHAGSVTKGAGAFDDLGPIASAVRATIDSVRESLPDVDREQLAQATLRLQHLNVLGLGLLAADNIHYRHLDVDGTNIRARLAKRAIALAAGELGVDPPKQVTWFTRSWGDEPWDFTREYELAGFYSRTGGEIGLNYDLPPEELFEVAGHEMAHHAGKEEAGASAFGLKFARRYAEIAAAATSPEVDPVPEVDLRELAFAVNVWRKYHVPVVPYIHI